MDVVSKLKFVFAANFITLGLTVWGYFVFLRIYFGDKVEVFYIDRYGEANAELFVIPVLIGVMVVSQFFVMQLMVKKGGL